MASCVRASKHPRHPERLVIGVLAILFATFAPTAHAEPQRAMVLYEEGVKAYNLGQFEAAITAFEAAYKEAPAPELLFNIAQSHRQLGHCQKALFSYRRFRQLKPTAPEIAEVDGHIERLSAQCPKRPSLEKPPPSSPPGPPPPSPNPLSDPPPRASAIPLTFQVSAGLAWVQAGDLDIPVQPTVSARAAYVLFDHDLQLDLGVMGTLTPVPYRFEAEGTAYLISGAISLEAAFPLAKWMSLTGTLNGGILGLAGLETGNPFTENNVASDGVLGLPTIGGALGVAIPLSAAWQLTLNPVSLQWSPRRSGLENTIRSLLRWNARVGLRYRL